jgi:hypothetical protein
MLTAMRHLRHAAFLGMLALASVAPAAAATITFTDSLPGVAMPNPLATGMSVTGTSGLTTVLSENVSGSIVNERRSPWDAGNSTVDFTARGAFYSAIQNGTAYFDLGVVRGGISFVWGTPGPQNVLELFLNGVSQFQVTGTGAVSPNEATYSRLTTVSDVRFDRITFTAAKPAFEFANLTISAVPLPAGGLLLLGALGGLMMLRRRSII